MNVAIEDTGTLETFQKERDTLRSTVSEAKEYLLKTNDEIDKLKEELEEKSKQLKVGPELANEYKRQTAELSQRKA